jgi:hypothetical protein
MKTKAALALALTVGLAPAGISLASDAKGPEPVVVKDQMTMRATVVAIDQTNRTVTLKGPKGDLMELIVDEGVTRFDAVKVGDVVIAGYSESAAFEIQKPGTPAAPDALIRGGGKITGDKPGGGAADTTVRTVTITAIDASKPTVTIKTSDGATEIYHVRHPEVLSRFKVGDQVKVTRTKSLLMKVEAAK